MSKKYDVIIIGAGMAGLSAAQHLADCGRSVLVVEARKRVGGRIHTLKTSNGTPIEMGANSLRVSEVKDKQNPLIPLLHNLNLRTKSIDSIHSEKFDASDTYRSAIKLLADAKKATWETWPTVGELLNFNKMSFVGMQTLTHMIQQHTGTAPHNVSLLELMHSDIVEESSTLFVSGGYQNLPEHMAKKASETGKVSLLLNTPIKSVHYQLKNKTTEVTTADNQTLTASTVLCTVPAGVLKKKIIHFFPALSEAKKAAIKNLRIGYYNKIILEFEKNFWEPESQYLFPGSDDYHHFPEYLNLYYFLNKKTPALVCNLYGGNALMKEHSDEHMIEKALLPLRHAYGKAITPLKNAFVTHWESDPYALGSTSCCGADSQIGELEQLAEPEPGGLFFAGAHTLSNQNRETVLGAYISGVRAALDIDQYLFRSNRLHTRRHQ